MACINPIAAVVKTTLYCASMGFLLLATSAFVHAQKSNNEQLAKERQYTQNIDYKLLKTAVAPSDPDKIEVVELFSYGCIHCFRFEPLLKAWKEQLTDDVLFRKIPVVFGNQTWLHYAQTYYTLKDLGVADRLNQDFFNALHKKRLDLRTPEKAAKFFAELGVLEEDFLDSYNSFTTHKMLSQDRAKILLYEVSGVPTLVIGGKYQIQNRSGVRDMLALANFLIRQERKLQLQGQP